MRKIYLDSCIAIYLVEEHPAYCSVIENTLAQRRGIVCHSPLTELECLVVPLRLQRTELLDKFARFFSYNVKLDMPDVVYREAARFRAEFGLKTPDALHLATARHHACTELWTNDNRLAHVAAGMAFNVVADVPVHH
jgi:predicted nucleic acid-binding protein